MTLYFVGEELCVEQLRDLHRTETELIQNLKKAGDSAPTVELQKEFRSHLRETTEHAKRLEQILAAWETNARGRPDETTHSGKMTDTALVAAARRAKSEEASPSPYGGTAAPSPSFAGYYLVHQPE